MYSEKRKLIHTHTADVMSSASPWEWPGQVPLLLDGDRPACSVISEANTNRDSFRLRVTQIRYVEHKMKYSFYPTDRQFVSPSELKMDIQSLFAVRVDLKQ